MKKSNNLLDPCYPEFNKIWFIQRMNHYNKITKWLVVANIVVWSTVACIVIKWLSV